MIRRLVAWLWLSPPLLLRLAKEETPQALVEAAVKLRRAGLEHLVDPDVSEEEVEALGMAGDLLEIERALLARKALNDPEALHRAFDGGKARRTRLAREALERFANGGDRGAA